jgi:hypothetical protein
MRRKAKIEARTIKPVPMPLYPSSLIKANPQLIRIPQKTPQKDNKSEK